MALWYSIIDAILNRKIIAVIAFAILRDAYGGRQKGNRQDCFFHRNDIMKPLGFTNTRTVTPYLVETP